jgi:hypothetical protein
MAFFSVCHYSKARGLAKVEMGGKREGTNLLCGEGEALGAGFVLAGFIGVVLHKPVSAMHLAR